MGREYALPTGRFRESRFHWPLSGDEFEERADATRPDSAVLHASFQLAASEGISVASVTARQLLLAIAAISHSTRYDVAAAQLRASKRTDLLRKYLWQRAKASRPIPDAGNSVLRYRGIAAFTALARPDKGSSVAGG